MEKHAFNKSMRIVLVVTVMMIAAAATQLYAIDANHRYFAYGLGQRSCEDYLRLREKRLDTLERQYQRFTKDDLYEIVDKVVEHWIAGFLTAHNLYVSDTYDVVGNLTMDELQARLEQSCRANPQQYVAEGMIKMMRELHPQRVKTEAGK
jgi:hypothetical protein